MQFGYFLLSMLFHEVIPYYFYNPITHRILNVPSLRDIPDGFKLIPPPRSRIGISRKGQNQNSYCTESDFRCVNPYAKAQTFQFECERDSQCPSFFKCCPQKCFQHKICVKAKLQPNKSKLMNSQTDQSTAIVESCGTDNFQCSKPFPHSSTAMFECVSDQQCLKTFKCCQQSCFTHKICSRSIPARDIPHVEEIRKKDKPEVVTSEEVGETEYETEATVVSTTEIITAEIMTTTIEPETSSESETITETTTEIETSIDTAVKESSTEMQTEITFAEEITISERSPMTTDENDDERGTITERVEMFVSFSETKIRKGRTTPDPNSIIAEYSEYYYDYDNRNDTREEYGEDDDTA